MDLLARLSSFITALKQWILNDVQLSEQEYVGLSRWTFGVGVPGNLLFMWYLHYQLNMVESLSLRLLCIAGYSFFFVTSFSKTYLENYLHLNRYAWMLFCSFQFIVFPYHMCILNNCNAYWLASFAFFSLAIATMAKGADVVISGVLGIFLCLTLFRSSHVSEYNFKMLWLYACVCLTVAGAAALHIRGLQFKLLEKARNAEDSYAKLHAYDMKKDDFVASVVHEVRTPLTVALAGMQDMMKLQDRHNDIPFLTAYNLVVSSLHSVKSQVNDLVEVERLSRGDLVLACELIDIDCWIPFIAEKLRALCMHKDLGFKLTVNKRGISSVFDPSRIETVLSNLVNNSVKFTHVGGAIEVVVDVDAQACLVFTVSDNGAGISKEDIPHSFTKYYQSEKHQGKALGIGIGLSLVKLIVNEHHGRVSVRSMINVGTLFKITLGNAKVDASKDTGGPSDVISVSPRPPGADTSRFNVRALKASIVVVDDSDSLRRIISDHLHSIGYEIRAFRNPLEALSDIREKEPTLVITDQNMLEMTGVDLMHKVREFQKAMPFIFVTAHTKIHEMVAPYSRTYVLEKPFVYADLEEVVDKALAFK